MNSDGSGVQRLTTSDGLDGRTTQQLAKAASDVFFPVFSPNGQQLAFGQITRHAGMDFWPAWSPDGRRLAFASNRDGTGLMRLTKPWREGLRNGH